ncbi:unnamed protein product [Ambrosiozyma monospora]|uniref:Unnamed protein product n=1 Tax=Ambrosiozyma monospora TaxID=43982 RepID=A0A9W6YXQ8_AMBMO|nr:unnamed protein product [Ambrosiozyma monospora]
MSSSTNIEKTKQKRTRSRSGCINCRKRKKKCDEIKPICTGCFKRKLVCVYMDNQHNTRRNAKSITNSTRNITNTTIRSTNTAPHSNVSVAINVANLLPNQATETLVGKSPSIMTSTIVCEDVVGSTVMKILLTKKTNVDNDSNTWQYFDLSDLFFREERAGISELRHQLPRSSLKVTLPMSLQTTEIKYLEYFCKSALPELSIFSQEHNYYSRIFVPMAFRHKEVLQCLVAWGYMKAKNEGLNYQVEDSQLSQYFALIDLMIAENNRNLTRDTFFINFVCYMMIVLMDVTFGDTVRWSSYFTSCFKMIQSVPRGFQTLITDYSEEGIMLAQNFAYIDIMASQSNENGALYPVKDYEELFQVNHSSNERLHDPMQGCIRPIIYLMGKILELLVESQVLHLTFEMTEEDKFDVINRILEGAHSLEQEIKDAKPDLDCAQFFEPTDLLENHLTLFECYQIAAQIYLKQVIRKFPPVIPEIELLSFRLLGDLKLLVEVPSFKKSLAFPLLVLGSCCITSVQRKQMKGMLDKLVQTCGYTCSYQKIIYVLSKLWEINENGKVYVDWYVITKQLGWRLNLGR